MRRAENKEKRPIYLKRKGDDKLLCNVLLNRLAIFQRKLILNNGGEHQEESNFNTSIYFAYINASFTDFLQ